MTTSTHPKVTEDEVKPRVIAAIRQEAQANNSSPGNISKLTAGDKTLILESQLKIGSSRRRALAQPYHEISQSHDGLPIGPKSSKAATTVGKAIKLVLARSNRKWK